MSDIAYPTLSRETVQALGWRIIAPTQVSRSPFDGSVQTGATQGPRWGAMLSLRRMPEADIVEMQAFAAKLRGRANRALIYNFARSVPRGTITTSGVTVNGALAVGATQLTLAGCGNAKTLLTGDFIGVGGQLLMVVDGPYTSTAGGAMANVVFEHPLRAAVSSGAAVTLTKPTCRMISTSDEIDWHTVRPLISEIGFEFEEAFS
jgi:hypothetical protein